VRQTRKGLENGRCPLCNKEKDAVHILPKCPETRTSEHLLSRKWKTINEETAYKKIINCISTVEIMNKGSYLYKTKCKLENRIKELQLDGE
jgi:hypothetical protein